MLIVSVGVNILLAAIVLFQYRRIVNRNKQLNSLHKKMAEIISENSKERLFLETDDKAVIRFLEELNQLLDRYHEASATSIRKEKAIKKMLTNMSHDLKTPLTTVLGYAEMLDLQKNLDAYERQRLLTKVHDKTKETLLLIHRFLDLAKLESGDQEIRVHKMPINEICRKTMLGYYDIVTEQGFEVELCVPDEPVCALVNEEALYRVLDNLIANAVNHGKDGKTVGLTLEQSCEDVTIHVWDKGRGIAEQHQDLVFERMYTLADSRSLSYTGSGLGLTITKRLVEKMGGTLRLLSSPHEKTVFSIQLKKNVRFD